MTKCLMIVSMAIMCMFNKGGACNEPYQYADEWVSERTYQREDGEVLDLTEDTNYDRMLNETKEMVVSTMKEDYPYLNWDLFEEVKIYNSTGIKLSTGRIVVKEFDVKYDFSLNCIAVFPKCAKYTEEYMKGLITHELIHALTYSEEACISQLWEGIADHYAVEICKAHGINFSVYYDVEEYFFIWIKNIFGEEQTLKMILGGTLEDNIEKLTKEGMGEKFNETIIMARYYLSYGKGNWQIKCDNAILAAQDIICHMAKNYVREVDKTQKQNILTYCKDMLIIYDKYFVNVLN